MEIYEDESKQTAIVFIYIYLLMLYIYHVISI